MAQYADYSLWRPSMAQLKALGVEGVCRYISDRDLTDSTTPAKNITPTEAKTLLDAGFGIVLVWETSASRAGEGAAAGAADVKAAEAQAAKLGYPATAPIFYAVDYDATVTQVKPYLDAVVANATRKASLGVYGSFKIIEAYVAPGKFIYGWQTRAWSAGNISPKAHLYQRVFEQNYDLNDVRRPIPTAWKKAAPPPPPPPPPPEPVVPISQQRTTFEGKQTTVRSVRMLKEARYLFRLRGGGVFPSISQGGWSTSVGASAGTHARDAFDFGTAPFSRERRLLWEWCCWEVGFASWRRAAKAGVWPSHDHALPKGGWLSDAAKGQIVQWNQGDNALVSDLDYPRILSSGFRTRTWETYLSSRPTGVVVDLSGLQTAFKTGGKSPAADNAGDNDVQQVQRALNHYLDSKLLVDGIAGPTTKGVYATYQARKYGIKIWSTDANGIPGAASLKGLDLRVVA